MGMESTQQERAEVLRMVRAEHGPHWWLLELPDGRWAAFWKQGFETDNRYDVESWIEEDRDEMRRSDPHNAA